MAATTGMLVRDEYCGGNGEPAFGVVLRECGDCEVNSVGRDEVGIEREAKQWGRLIAGQ